MGTGTGKTGPVGPIGTGKNQGITRKVRNVPYY